MRRAGSLRCVDQIVHCGLEQRGGARQGRPHGAAEKFAEFERACADGEQERRLRSRVIEVAGEREERGRAGVMRGKSELRSGGLDGLKVDLSRRGVDGTIEKYDRVGCGNVDGEVGRPLMTRDHADA